MNLDRERWNARYRQRQGESAPDAFLGEAYEKWIASTFPNAGWALDLAGGCGQNSIYLAERGWRVTLVDVSDVAIECAQREASGRGLGIECKAEEAGKFLAGSSRFDLVMVFLFLDRSLMDSLRQAVRPGGMLIYRTYTTENLRFGRGPSNPAFLLQPGELRRSFADFTILHERESDGDPAVAELVALSP